MIAVTGATGQLGQLVIQKLVENVPASSVVALVRNPAKAEGLKKLGVTVRAADYDEPGTWPAALAGVRTLLLISSNEIGKRQSQHQTVVAAAKRAGIQHLVYTSILKADTSPLGLAKEHLATENAIKDAGVPYTFLRNGWYLENHTENLAAALAHGTLHGSAKDGRFSSASRADYALAAVRVLTGTGHANKVYELAGDTSFTLADLAAAVAHASGKAVGYLDHSYADYRNALLGFGLPEVIAEMLADSDVGAAKGGLQSDSRDLSRLIGRPTTALSEALKTVIKSS